MRRHSLVNLFAFAPLALATTVPLWLASAFVAHAEVDLDTAAARFGQMPAVWGMRLSPDGQRVSFLKLHPNGMPIAMVIDLKTGKGNLVLASDEKKGVDLLSCEWANDTRLLCTYFGLWRYRGEALPATRLVAADIDGKNIQVLVQRQQQRKGQFDTTQAEIVDFLSDEPNYIWLQQREDNGNGVTRVDIYKNRLKTVERPLNSVWQHWTDDQGEIRLRANWDQSWVDYEYRLTGESRWRKLYRRRADDDSIAYHPASIEPKSNELLVWDWYDGRRALFKEWLTDDATKTRKRELVVANPEADLESIATIGKYRRAIGVEYQTDAPHIEYFDQEIQQISRAVSQELVDSVIEFVDESWDRRFYLIKATSDTDPGTYYRYDSKAGTLSLITRQYPWLEDIALAKMEPIRYPIAEGQLVAGYLTQPVGAKRPVPLIVYPHGGPEARDGWGFNEMAQFLPPAAMPSSKPTTGGPMGTERNGSETVDSRNGERSSPISIPVSLI